MNQIPSMQAPESEFGQQLAALTPEELGDFILNIFFDTVGALESEGAAWAHTHAAGQGDTEYLLRMETEFQAKVGTFETNVAILLQDSEQRARDFVFQIKWWEQRLADVRRNSDERLAAVQATQPPPTPEAEVEVEVEAAIIPPPPVEQAPAPSEGDTQPINLGAMSQPPPEPPSAPQSAPQEVEPPSPPKEQSAGGALNMLRAELERSMSAESTPPSAPPEPPSAYTAPSPIIDASPQSAGAAGNVGDLPPSEPSDPLDVLQGQVQSELLRVQDLERQLAATADVRTELETARTEIAYLRQQAEKADALGAQLLAVSPNGTDC